MKVNVPAISVDIAAGLQVPVTGVEFVETSGRSGAVEY